ncbi:MAG TPA: tRNA (N6-isopentenyl adenosine(37)-C2)-methylthiotransferase MiaB [Deltaproteobacteria bacterium]|nr:tRNA (N6-isopentenyl adenosine(37)-C2)-methylthiotransferase MiaB [Deltaproteobacteria bacterium]
MGSHVKIFTYGCQMNDLDTQKMFSELARGGMVRTEDTREADVIIINTCSVRQKAYEKTLSNLGRLSSLKKRNPGLIIVVAGCVAQQEGAALVERMPHVDLVIGTHQLHRIRELIEKASREPAPIVVTDFSDAIPFMDLIPDGDFVTPGHRASINIMQGCNNFCSYCIVPYVRGRELSRDASRIIEEVQIHASRGVKEVFLLGQNVNSFDGGMSFPGLLREIDAIEGIERIRFTTSHPKDVSEELIACFGSLKTLCSHLHLPFQAGSNRVLKAMNRHYTKERYLDLIERLRQARPDIAFSADVMVGFPGETHEDFLQTLDIMERVRFDVLYSFRYSTRPGTRAASRLDDVPFEEKSERLYELQRRQKEITLENNRMRVGTCLDVLVDSVGTRCPGQVRGRSTHNTVVNLPGDESLVGTIVQVLVTRANANSLTGELAS